jgi:hypothetical protein
MKKGLLPLAVNFHSTKADHFQPRQALELHGER